MMCSGRKDSSQGREPRQPALTGHGPCRPPPSTWSSQALEPWAAAPHFPEVTPAGQLPYAQEHLGLEMPYSFLRLLQQLTTNWGLETTETGSRLWRPEGWTQVPAGPL